MLCLRCGEAGRGLAIAGLVVGYVGLAFTVLYVLLFVAIGEGMLGY